MTIGAQNRDASVCLSGGYAALTAKDRGLVQAHASEQYQALGSWEHAAARFSKPSLQQTDRARQPIHPPSKGLRLDAPTDRIASLDDIQRLLPAVPDECGE